jgi:hypothetical protein
MAGPHVDRDELYKECVTALDGGALLESKDLSEAEAALTHAFLHADKRLLSWYAVRCPIFPLWIIAQVMNKEEVLTLS